MATQVELLERIVRHALEPDKRAFLIGWCLAGQSDKDLEELLDALAEFDELPDRIRYLQLVDERYQAHSRLS
jgi:hypothetical protein